MAGVDEGTGLRERKKADTRAAIRGAVLGMALQRGLDDVTTDEIAAAANVSVRTFHNYFGSKEEALLEAWRLELQVHVDALRARPAEEPILVSLEHILRDITTRLGEHPHETVDHVDLLRAAVAMPRQRSALLDEAVRLVTEVVAQRTGTDTSRDIYPHLVTAAAIAATMTTFQFAPPTASTAQRHRLLQRSFALLQSGLQAPPGRIG